MGSTVPNWPPVSGEYLTGDPGLHAAVITLASELDKERLIQHSAIAGSMKTENIGIEKIVANIVSNTSIRYLVICGAEVHGHLAGDALMAMHRSGIDDEGRIVGAKGAIPYITNIDSDTINIWHPYIKQYKIRLFTPYFFNTGFAIVCCYNFVPFVFQPILQHKNIFRKVIYYKYCFHPSLPLAVKSTA